MRAKVGNELESKKGDNKLTAISSKLSATK